MILKADKQCPYNLIKLLIYADIVVTNLSRLYERSDLGSTLSYNG